MITNATSGTRIDEVGPDLYRIHTPIDVPDIPGGFSFNQYLIKDDSPLLFHTGPRRLFPFVREAIAAVLPVETLRWVGLSHVEADECGSINELLAVAPQAQPLCGQVAAMVSMADLADREPRAMADGETLELGTRRVRWIDAAHVPHGWECGFLFEETSASLFCGDLFTQPGSQQPAVVESDILGPSETFRQAMDYYAHAPHTGQRLRHLADLEPQLLACMHGSAWRGAGGALLRDLASAVAPDTAG